MTRAALARSAAAALLLLTACVKLGREFPVDPIQTLEIGRTTQADVQRAFGTPWRTGLEDGRPTWTYGRYRYSIFGAHHARDLVVEFDERGVLTSYTYSSTERDQP
jgi:hypothetical protein